ncbi:MAG: hypothetical protein ACTHL1_03210 [Burkholderiaceae bacterium]
METSQIETLSACLCRLRERLHDRLAAAGASRDEPLADDDPLVRAARDCDFMLPRPLTAAALADTVERKIDTVRVLLERARRHEALPEAAQAAADEGYLTTEEDVDEQREKDG